MSPGTTRLKLTLAYAGLAVIAFQALFPIVWMLSNSLKTTQGFYTNIWGAPTTLEVSNYLDAWTEGKIGLFLGNSVFVIVVGLIVLLVTSCLAAYALARLKFPGRDVIFWLILATMMVPPDVLVIPLFLVVKELGILNTRYALSLIYAAGGLGISTFLLRGYFMAIPEELVSAAVIDGASRLQVFWRIILPLARPGLVTVIILQAMGMWNDLYLAFVFIRREEMATVPLGLLGFFRQHTVIWPKFFAGLMLVTVPILVIYILGQKQFVRGMTATGIKG
ncbi:MAG: carbohydrate ABC transporter permease [Chloroflexi bacterium]|nr:carbohydrate ABC transporter permease [Chloroflexota bacterium]